MRLRDLVIQESRLAATPDGEPFRWTTHHVAEVFLALLPKQFVLDGSVKVQITCGPRGDEPKCQQMLGSTEYFNEGFDFNFYYDQPPCDRQEVILRLIEDSFIDIMSYCDPLEGTRFQLRDTVAAVREHDFALSIPSHKLSRSAPGRKVRVNVFRNLSHELGEVWSIRVVGATNRSSMKDGLGRRPDHLDMRGRTRVPDGMARCLRCLRVSERFSISSTLLRFWGDLTLIPCPLVLALPNNIPFPS